MVSGEDGSNKAAQRVKVTRQCSLYSRSEIYNGKPMLSPQEVYLVEASTAGSDL